MHKPDGQGYKRQTIGPPSNGTLVYEHRVAAGVGSQHPGKGAKTVVDHKNGKRADDRKSNLRVVSRSVNNLAKNKHK